MKSLRSIFTMLLPLAFIACGGFEEVDLGYPKTVEFSKNGGELTVHSEMYFTHVEIQNYENGEDGETTVLEDGTLRCTYKWLSIEYQKNKPKLRIIAEPNNTQSRKLHIKLYSGYQYQVIEVFQEAHHLIE